jgi:hypothetical protein
MIEPLLKKLLKRTPLGFLPFLAQKSFVNMLFIKAPSLLMA